MTCLFAAQNRQCLELLSMLNVKEQRVYQESKPQYSTERDSSVLEVSEREKEEEIYSLEKYTLSQKIKTSALHSVQLPHTL